MSLNWQLCDDYLKLGTAGATKLNEKVECGEVDKKS